MFKAASGLVIDYAYLWAREHEKGEISGRKDRPVCVQVLLGALPKGENRTPLPPSLLFPITSQTPSKTRRALAIPELECQRAKLRSPAWVIVDEWNEDDLLSSPNLASTQARGSFGKAFTAQIRAAAVAAVKSDRIQSVPRVTRPEK